MASNGRTEQQRTELLKKLQLSLRLVIASAGGARSEVVLEDSTALDHFCGAVEGILRFGLRGKSKRASVRRFGG